MSRARRVLDAFAIGIFNQLLITLVGLGVTRFTLHRIGSHDYGLWIISGQFFGYLALLDLGITALLPREVAIVAGKPIDEQARESEMREVIGRSVSLVVLLLPPLALASLGIFLALPADWSVLRLPLAINLAIFVLTYPLRVASATLSGLQDLAYLAWVQVVTWAIGTAAMVVLVAQHCGLLAVAIGPSLAQVLSSVACVVRLLSRYRRFVPRKIRWFDRATMRAHALSGVTVTMAQIAQLLTNSTDALIIGRLRGPEAVITYSLTDKTQTLLNNQPYALAHLAGPALGGLKAAGDRPRLLRSLGALASVVLTASGGIFVAVVVTNHAFVRIWVGEEHFGGVLLTILLVANMIARHWVFTYLQALFFFGRERVTSLVVLLDGLITVGASIPLVHRFGAVGAPAGQLLGALLGEAPILLVLTARELQCSVAALLAKLAPWFVRFVPVATASIFAGAWLGGSSLFHVAIAGAATALVYALVMLPLARRPPLDTYALPYLRKVGLAPRATATTEESASG